MTAGSSSSAAVVEAAARSRRSSAPEQTRDGRPSKGELFIAPECKQAASAYLGKQDKLQSFLDEHCVRRETAPMRQWLGVKEMLATYNAEMGTTLKEKDLKEKLKSHRATSADYKEKGQAILSDAPLRRNTANGLLNWQLKAADEGEASTSKRQRKKAVRWRLTC